MKKGRKKGRKKERNEDRNEGMNECVENIFFINTQTNLSSIELYLIKGSLEV